MKQIFNIYIIIIIFFYAFWIGGLPFIFSKTLPVICENISANSNFNVKAENPRLALNILPAAKIKAEKIEVRMKNSDNFTLIENPEIKIRILPLLSGRVHINRITASGLAINSHLKEKIELDKDFLSNLNNTKVKCDMVRLNNFKITIWQKNVSKPIIYTGKDIFYQKNNRFIKVNLDSKINVQDNTSAAKINLYIPKKSSKSIMNVNITNFDIAPLGDYLKQYLPKDLARIKGIINVNVDNHNLNAEFKHCAVIMKDSAKSIKFPDILNITSDFNITGKTISFEKVDINSKNIHASLNGSLSNYIDKTLTAIDLNVQLDKSRVEDIVDLLPPIVVEEFNVYRLKKYKFYGSAIGNFSIKGNLKEPDIAGDIYIDDGILIKPIKNARGATIKLGFTGKYVNFDVFVPAGGLEKVWVKGGVELYNVKYSDMRIWSTKNVNLKTAEDKVVPLHEILNFIIGPVPIMDVNGVGNIDIIVKGNRKNPHVWGSLNLNNVKTHFNEIPDLVLSQADASLHFNDQNAVFKTKRGMVNNKPINIQGTCNLYGKFDFDVKTNNQEIGYLFKAIQTSTMIEELKGMLPELDLCQGLVNLNLKVYGSIKDIEYIKFNENFFTKGNIDLLGNTFAKDGVKIHSTKGKIKTDGLNAEADITSFIGKSPISVKAAIKNNFADASISIPKLNLNDITRDINAVQKDFGNIFVNVAAKYKGKLNKIEYDKVNFTAKIINAAPQNLLQLSNGEITLNNGKLNISKLNGNIKNSQSSFNINLNAENIFTKPYLNGNIKLSSFELALLNNLSTYTIIPKELKNIRFDRGKINLNCSINNNKINAYTDLGGLAATYTPLELPIKIVNGSLIIRNNTLRLNKLNLLADNMPVLIDGDIHDIFDKQIFNIYLNSKPKQEFIDKYVNKNQIYPVKIKGDIVYTAKFKGTKDNFDVKADVNMPKDSSIYHLGATVGDVENSIVLNLDTKIIKQNILKIKEFSYDKLISAQNGRQTRLNMLKARGGIDVYKDDLVFHDLHIKTQNPTDARIFNIIFRKPNIKQGQFTSDLKFNGKVSDPKLIGNFHIFETNIPFLDTTMKNITFVFKEKTVELSSIGEVLGNDITVRAVLKNKLTAPYYVEKADLYTKVLDLNYIINKLKLSQVDNFQTFESFEGFDLSTIIIKNLKMNADSIYLRNIIAENFESSASINEKGVVDVNNFKFDIANGILNGNFTYNLKNNHTGLKIKAKNIDANDLSIALFDLNNQLYGDLTGNIELSCDGTNFDNCMKTLNGKSTFNVADGRMPKLGSLEYLLKAGNLLKGGVTGISINSVIDIITPLKTGNFSSIYGSLNIQDGIANDIEISTRGKDLSLFINGQYNFSTSNAEMEVLGMLSKKISTMFGPIGNLSLNTLFNAIPGVDLSKDTAVLEKINKIPGIELSSKAYRKFIAEIKGNINGEDYVTSFKWIN